MERRHRQQRGRRQGGRQGRHPRFHAGLQHAHQALRHVHLHRRFGRRTLCRLGPRQGDSPHEVAGLRPRFDQPAVFELAQRLHHCRHRQPPLLGKAPHRWQTIAVAQHPTGDHSLQIGGQSLVTQQFSRHGSPIQFSMTATSTVFNNIDCTGHNLISLLLYHHGAPI